MRSMTAGRVAGSIDQLIGGTPLVRVRLDGLPDDADVLAKLESTNPLSSIKDRVALSMMDAAERRGELTPGATVVEATSGNTGIALSALAAVRGYRCVTVMPDNATLERRRTVELLGARVELSPHELGLQGVMDRAEEIHLSTPGSWYAGQHRNADNVLAHYTTTGPEIWADTDGRVDVLVCGVGTGGTITGIARYLRERRPDVRIVAVEPAASPILSGGPAGTHRIPGLHGGIINPVTDLSCIDEVITVSDEDAADTTRRIARSMGLLVGVSAGAAAHGCLQLARRHDLSGRTVVTIFPDTGERYLSWWSEPDAEPS